MAEDQQLHNMNMHVKAKVAPLFFELNMTTQDTKDETALLFGVAKIRYEVTFSFRKAYQSRPDILNI